MKILYIANNTTNDIRATLKKEINFLSNSNIIEEKSYERY